MLGLILWVGFETMNFDICARIYK